jgi:hypothetical protein
MRWLTASASVPPVAGTTNALSFGTSFWGQGAGSGPWFLGDFGDGLWAGGALGGDPGSRYLGNNPAAVPNAKLPSMNTVDFAFGILETSTVNDMPRYAIKVGNAQSGTLSTAYDGQAPAEWQGKGGIVLGIGSDNSNVSLGTFFEGAITAGRPSDATDAAVLQNAQAAGYGH